MSGTFDFVTKTEPKALTKQLHAEYSITSDFDSMLFYFIELAFNYFFLYLH